MGCSQSKTTSDQIVERVSSSTSAVPAPAIESLDAPATEAATEAPPASTKDLPPSSTSAQVGGAEEAPKSKESDAAAAEEETEKTADPAEEMVKGEGTAPAEESLVPETGSASVKEVAEAPAPVEEKAVQSEGEASKSDEVTTSDVKAAALKSEPDVEKEAPKSAEEAPKSAEEAPKSAVEEPKAEVMTVAPISQNKPAENSLIFRVEDVTFDDNGVAFYNFDGCDSANPANNVHVSKRYSEFKVLHAQLIDYQGLKAEDLPALPKTSFLLGRRNKNMLDDRKAQFAALLNAIAAHPTASGSDVFRAFLAN